VTGPPFDPDDYDPKYGEMFDSPWLYDNDDTNIPGADLDHDSAPLQLTVTWTFKEYTTVCGDTDCALPPCDSGTNCTFNFRDDTTPELTSVTLHTDGVVGSDPALVSAAGVAADGDILHLVMPRLGHFLSLGANRTAATAAAAAAMLAIPTVSSLSPLLQVMLSQSPEQVEGHSSAAWRLASLQHPERSSPLQCVLLRVAVPADAEAAGTVECRLQEAATAGVGIHSLRVRINAVGDTKTVDVRTGPRVDRVSTPGMDRSSQGGGMMVVIEGRGLMYGDPIAAARALLEWERAEPVRDGISRPPLIRGSLPAFPISGAGGSSFALPDIVLPLTGTRCRLTAMLPPSATRVACVVEALPPGGPAASYESGVALSLAGALAECAAPGGMDM